MTHPDTLDERGLLAAFRANHHPDAEPSSIELAALSRSIRAYLSTAPSGVRVPDTVWIVGASVGEYSDRTTWTVGVWESKADAEAFILKIDALGRLAVNAAEAWLEAGDDDADETAAKTEAESACKAVDPGWSSYSGDAPIYSCWQEKVHLSALSALSAAPVAAEAVAEWSCRECGCRTFARIDDRQSDGGYQPGRAVRCINCKTVDNAFAAVPTHPSPPNAMREAATELLRSIDRVQSRPATDSIYGIYNPDSPMAKQVETLRAALSEPRS